VRCQYAHEDGAYVLGALSPTERAAYERHLATCPSCRRAVADLAVLPGLLSRLPGPEEASALVEAASQVQPPPEGVESRLPRLLAAAVVRRRRERRSRAWRAVLAVLAVGWLALVVGVGIGVDRQESPTTAAPSPTPKIELVAMVPVSTPVPVTAEIGLSATGWGTEVRMHCTYDTTNPRHTRAWTLRLIAYGPGGQKEQVGSWSAAPGADINLTGVTRFAPDELVRIELVRADGAPLLTYHVP
jgi:hypothetical protein